MPKEAGGGGWGLRWQARGTIALGSRALLRQRARGRLAACCTTRLAPAVDRLQLRAAAGGVTAATVSLLRTGSLSHPCELSGAPSIQIVSTFTAPIYLATGDMTIRCACDGISCDGTSCRHKMM